MRSTYCSCSADPLEGMYGQSGIFLSITKNLFQFFECKYSYFFIILRQPVTISVTVFYILTKVDQLSIRAYPALYLGGTPSQETGTSPPSCLLLENRLYIYCQTSVLFFTNGTRYQPPQLSTHRQPSMYSTQQCEICISFMQLHTPSTSFITFPMTSSHTF